MKYMVYQITQFSIIMSKSSGGQPEKEKEKEKEKKNNTVHSRGE